MQGAEFQWNFGESKLSLRLACLKSVRPSFSNFPRSPYPSWASSPQKSVLPSTHGFLGWPHPQMYTLFSLHLHAEGCSASILFPVASKLRSALAVFFCSPDPAGVETDERYNYTPQSHILLLVPFWPHTDAGELVPEHSRFMLKRLLPFHVCVAFEKREHVSKTICKMPLCARIRKRVCPLMCPGLPALEAVGNPPHPHHSLPRPLPLPHTHTRSFYSTVKAPVLSWNPSL